MTVRVLTGDCREILPTLDAGGAHCCITSPPYFGLRDYGTAQWEGGDEGCGHARKSGGERGQRLQGGEQRGRSEYGYRDTCGKCGARRIDRQIGLEATPEAYVAELVAVFREVRRVLRDDGTLWLNLGDSYSSGSRTTQTVQTARRAQVVDGKRLGPGRRSLDDDPASGEQEYLNGTAMRPPAIDGLGSKQLLGIPWRVALALQVDGWCLRQDIIWSKPNPMPESVCDRCTKAHEYIFLLSKQPRYYFDAGAIAEPAINAGRVVEYDGSQKTCAVDPVRQRTTIGGAGGSGRVKIGETRNKRSVWHIATQSFSEAHFATFPPALVEPMVLAGCPPGGVMLDPFAGSGTVGLVADRMQRDAVLIELNPQYVSMQRSRIERDAPLYAEVEDAARLFEPETPAVMEQLSLESR